MNDIAQPAPNAIRRRTNIIDLLAASWHLRGRPLLQAIIICLMVATGGVDAAIIEPGEEDEAIQRQLGGQKPGKRRRRRKR